MTLAFVLDLQIIYVNLKHIHLYITYVKYRRRHKSHMESSLRVGQIGQNILRIKRAIWENKFSDICKGSREDAITRKTSFRL